MSTPIIASIIIPSHAVYLESDTDWTVYIGRLLAVREFSPMNQPLTYPCYVHVGHSWPNELSNVQPCWMNIYYVANGPLVGPTEGISSASHPVNIENNE